MTARLPLALFLFVVEFCFSITLFGKITGADIDESFIEVELYVSQERGASDHNSGSSEQPLATIQAAALRALQMAQENQGVRINIKEGTYRERIRLQQPQYTGNALIVFQGVPGARVIISGSDISDGWKVGESDSFEIPWTYSQEEEGSDLYPKRMMRSDLVFVQGARVIQVDSLLQVSIGGRFYIDDEKKRAYMLPPKNGTVAEGKVQVGNPQRSTLFEAIHIDELVLRNLLFIHSPSRPVVQEAAVSIQKSNHLLIENCAMRYNNFVGVSITDSDNVSLKTVHSKNNGWAGFHIKACSNVVMIACDADLNGWRMLDAQYSNKGSLFAVTLDSCRELKLEKLRCTENRSSGVYGRALEDAALSEVHAIANDGDGLRLQGEDEVEVKGGLYLHNRLQGIRSEAPFVLTGNVVYDNHAFQVIASSGLKAKRNIIGSSKPGGLMVSLENYSLDKRAEVSSEKSLYDCQDENAFNVNGKALHFMQWQSALGIDLDSMVGDPLFEDPQSYDYIPVPKSPWFRMKQWPVRALTDEEIHAAYAELFAD